MSYKMNCPVHGPQFEMQCPECPECPQCRDGSPVTVVRGIALHECFGIMWRCADNEGNKHRDDIEDRCRDEIANSGDC